jgi:hypothetical protein
MATPQPFLSSPQIAQVNKRTTNEQRMSRIIVVKSRARSSYDLDCFVEQSRLLEPRSVPFVVASSSEIIFSIHSCHRGRREAFRKPAQLGLVVAVET